MAADASEPDRVAVLHEDVAAVSVFVFRYVVVGFLRAACAALAAVPMIRKINNTRKEYARKKKKPAPSELHPRLVQILKSFPPSTTSLSGISVD